MLKHIFGCKGDKANAVVHVEEHKICYLAGHNVVVYNIEDKLQSFFPGLEGSTEISGMCISPLKRFLAVAERSP